MALDPATVRRIATLARIRMDDAEVATLAGELNTIFGWIEQLNEVDRATLGSPWLPTAQCGTLAGALANFDLQ